MPTRRQLLKATTVGGAALLVPTAYLVRTPAYADPVPGGTLDPKTITKYATPLYVPPALAARPGPGGVDAYEIAVRQVNQRVLPPGHPTTRVFAFGALSGGAGFHWPGPTIEARVGRPVQVRWANQLMTPSGVSCRKSDAAADSVSADRDGIYNRPHGCSGKVRSAS